MGDWAWWLEILLVNLVLSGDNAIVIGMAGRGLPPDERRKAIAWGTAFAVALRLVMTVFAAWLFAVPYVRMIGAACLVWIAVKLSTQDGGGISSVRFGGAGSEAAPRLREAVRTIVFADFVMSLDNALAVAALSEGSAVATAVGVALSIPLTVWGGGLAVRLLDRFPVLVVAGAAVLAYTAGGMLIEDPHVVRVVGSDFRLKAIPPALVALTIALGLLGRRLFKTDFFR